MKSILFTEAMLIDPQQGNPVSKDLWVANGKIQGIFSPGSAPVEIDAQVTPMRGNWIFPGFVDMHVHLREPGQSQKETIETGTLAAAVGGITAVCAMPNTTPTVDTPEAIQWVIDKALEKGLCTVYPVGAITKGLEGNELTDFAALKAAGAIAVTDDGKPILSSDMLKKALLEAKQHGLMLISHCEELTLARNGCIVEGPLAAHLNVVGIPREAETAAVKRDIAIAAITNAPIHIAHVSTKGSVDAIRAAKKSGIPVTAETTPHYLTRTADAISIYGTHAKMNPPLAFQEDQEALLEGLLGDTIDVISTDHAPHTVEEKSASLMTAPFGVVGLETSVAMSLSLVNQGKISLSQMAEKMSLAPARILGISRGLSVGNPATLTIIDPTVTWSIHANAFKSKGRNTPFENEKITGKTILTMVDGKITYRRDALL